MLNKYGTSRRPDASVVFTDREEPRETFSQFFERLYKRNVRGETGGKAPLLYFYGVGGVGKTTLLTQAHKEFCDRFGGEIDFVSVHVAHLDLHGLQLGANLPMPDMLWLLRNALVHDKLSTPLFDCVYLLLWEAENPGRKLDLPKSAGWKAIGKTIDSYDDIAKQIDQFADSNGLVKWVRQRWDQGVQAWRRKRVAERWGDIHPSEWSQQQRRERLGELLWMDIVDSLESDPLLRVALLIDEFERIQTTEPKASDAQTALADLLGALVASDSEAVRQRLCVAMMGREKLRWEITHDPDWKPLIESHILGGLSERDAKGFLIDKVATWYRNKGNERAANAIIDHQNEILRVTNSAIDGEEPSHLPFHLDLVLDVVNTAPEKFSAELLANEAGHRRALEDRFLRYLKGHNDQLLKTLQVLALCQSFDRTLFDYLLSERVIVGFAPSDFMQIVGEDHSYVGPNPNLPGSHLFHRQMQLALINSQLTTDEVKSGTRERLGKVLEYFIQQAQFDSPVSFSNSHHRSFLFGFEVLKGEAAAELLSPLQVSDYADRLVNSFDVEATPRLLQPFFEWVSKFCELELGNHPDTLCNKNSLGVALLNTGELIKARNIFEEVLSLEELNRGGEHPETLSVKNNLAMTLLAQGAFSEARLFLEDVLAKIENEFGAGHPKTLKVINNLAIALSKQGDFTGARKLFEKALSLSEQIWGQGHPETLMYMGNLATTLADLGKSKEGLELCEKVLSIREQILGVEHPDTLISLHNKASSLRDDGDLPAARNLLEKVFALRERIQGTEHPETLRTMDSLAVTLWDQGNLPAARDLFEQLVSLRERVLGHEHPDTLKSENGLAGVLRDLKDLPAARDRYEKVAVLRERVLGEHRDTLASMDKLADTCRDQGDWPGTQKWAEKVMLLSERLLGAEHKETLRSMNDLALALTECGDLSGAQQMLHKALSISVRVLGSTHPATITMMENQRGVLHAQGDFAGAQRLHAEVLQAQRRNQGRHRRSKR